MRERVVPVGLLLVGIGWVLVVPYLLFRSALIGFSLFGAQSLTEAQVAERDLLRTMGAVGGVVLPLLGTALAGFGGRRVAARIWFCCFLFAVVVALLSWRTQRHAVPEPSGPIPCMEHSGGDNVCPGN